MGLLFSFSSKQARHQTKPNNKKLTSTGFKQQRICTPLAPTRKKIIYKTACSDGPRIGSGNRLKTGFAQRSLPSSTMRVLLQCSFVIWEIIPINGSCSALWRCIPLSKLNPMRSSSRRASSTIWMQACKRCAARAVNLAGVETNCIKCGQVIMIAGSVTLVQEYGRFSLPKDQVYPQSVQTRFWTGNCQLC